MTDHSLQDVLQGSWKQLSGTIHSEWGKLTHNDVEQIKGNVEVLAGKIQERYGVVEAEARRQIKEWVRKFKGQQASQTNDETPAK